MPNNMAATFEVSTYLTPDMAKEEMEARQNGDSRPWSKPYRRFLTEDGCSIIEIDYTEINGRMLDAMFEANTTPMAAQILTGVAPRKSRNGFDPSLMDEEEE